MKSYESTLALLHSSRHFCRLLSSSSSSSSSSYSQSTIVGAKSISILFILFLLTSVAAAQRQQSPLGPSASNSSTINVSSSVHLNPVRRRPTTSSSLSPLSTTTSKILALKTSSFHLEANATSALEIPSIPGRKTVYLVLIIIICSLMTCVTVLGNLVVILAVCLVRRLQTASNILIVSLAVSDVFVGLFIMPLALVLEICNGKWILGSIMCDIWTSTDVLLCTSSILNFLVISIDRYCIINHPFKYAPMRKVKLLSLMIAAVWILSALVSLPPILGWGRPSENLPTCQVNTKLDYQIFATMLSFYIPLIVVLIIYANIYRTARTAIDNRSSVQMSQFLNHSSSNVTPTPVLAQQQINGNSCSNPQSLLNVYNPHGIDDGSSISAHDQRHTTGGGGRRSAKRSNTNSNDNKTRNFLSPSRCLGRRISTPFNGRLSIFVTRRYSFFRHVHLPNQKAIRTLGVILGTFIVCWLPFMLYAIIKPLHEHITRLTSSQRQLNAPEWLDPVLLWFGYSSSMLNPLIYSKFNREFRTPFREIICCRCRGLNEKIRRQEYLENLYGDVHLPVPSNQMHQHQTGATSHSRGSGSLAAAV